MAYNKKVLSKAVSELGKAKAPAKPRDITVDPMGYWNPANQGQPVRVPGNEITMKGVNHPIWAQPNVGPGAIMYPEQNRNFKGASYVDETPIGRRGGTLKSKKYSKSMSATNKLFAKNKLFQNKKSKIFDPNAEFKSGGSKLGPINLDPNPLSHYELNYGYNLPTEQDGGVHSNPWLYTYIQENEDRAPGQAIGLGADFQHKSGLHGSTNVELPFFNKNAMGNLYSELGYNKRFKNFDADATLKNYTEPGSKFNPSFTTGVGYNKNLGDHINFSAGVNNTMVPGSLFNPTGNLTLKYTLQEGGENNDEYEDLELTDEEIQAYRDGGYVVKEISEYEEGGYVQHELVKAQKGLIKKPLEISDPKEYAFRNKMYADSLSLYNNSEKGLKNLPAQEIQPLDKDMIKGWTYSKIQPIGQKKDKQTNYKGETVYPVFKKPVQPVVLKQPVSNNTPIKSKNVESKKPLEISDPKKFKYLKKMQDDSLKMYNLTAPFKDKGKFYPGEWDSRAPGYSGVSLDFDKYNIDKYWPSIDGWTLRGDKINPNIRPIGSRVINGIVVYPQYKKPVQPVKFVPKKDKPKSINTTSNTTTEPISTLPLKPIERFVSPEQTIIPARPYVKPVHYRNWNPTLYHGENMEMPEGYNQQDVEKEIRKRDADEFTRKTLEYQAKQRGTKQPVSQIRKEGGYVQHELAKAQGGKTVYSGVNYGLKGPSSPKPKVKKTDTSPSVANAKKLEQFRKLQEQNRQQNIQNQAKQKENDLMKRMPKTQVSDNTRTVTPKQAVSDINNAAIIKSPQYKAEQKAKKEAAALAEIQRKKAQAEFEKKQWAKYNKASTMEKIVDRSQAALSQPLLMAANFISGDQAYIPGMHEGLMNTESPDYDKFLSATKQSRGLGVNDVFNTFNPGNWGAHARNEMNKGNVASGATEMGLGILGLKGLKTASGLVKGSANVLNKAEGKLAKFIPERAPSTPSTGGGNLNAGFSPELIQGAIGPKNKVIANIADKSYMPFLNKAMNRISPLNWVPGYGKKLEGAIKPLGNVIGNSIENGKLVESKSLFNKAKGLVKKGPDADLTTKVGKTNASDIYSAKIDGSVDGSKIGLGSANQQGFIGRNFRKGNASYPIQNNWGTGVKQVPLTDAGVSLNRRLPFSNRYVPIDKEKLMNNKFQWATTGAGLQKVGEKFGAAALTTGIGAGAIAGSTYDPMSYVKDQDVADQIRLENGDPNDYIDLPTRTEAIMKGATDAMGAPSEYLKEGFIPNIIGATGEAIKGNLKQGGTIEEVWEDELDEHTIALLRKAGYTVEELD